MRISLIILFAILSVTGYSQTIENFSLRDIENERQSFNDLKGEKITIIDFWATWCKPCIKSIPELNKIYDNYKDRGVEIIGINCDGPRSTAKAGAFSKSLKIKYPVLLDIESKLMSDLNLSGLPALVMVDSGNNIVWIHEGFVKGDELLIARELDKILTGNR